MKRFTRNIVIIIVATLVCIMLYNQMYLYCFTKEEKDHSRYSAIKFQHVPSNIEVANIGSSHGVHSFNYEKYDDMSCFNFALLGQTLSYDWRILQNYGDNMKAGSVLFIPISYFSLYCRDEILLNNFESKNETYYKILSPSLVKNYSPMKGFLLKYCQAISYSPDVAIITAIKSKHVNAQNDEMKDTKDFKLSAENAYRNHYLENLNDGKLVVNKEEMDALVHIIEYCKENGIRPILITTPFRQEYNEKWDEDFYEMFYSDIEQIVSETDVEYYDYSHDVRFTSNESFFVDADHLNDDGAKSFTSIVFKEVLKK